jgi:hypothetical protein
MSASKAAARKPSGTPKGIRAHKMLIAWLLGTATLLGGISVVIPRPVVFQTADPVDSKNPFSVPFTITNTGFIPLTHVTAYVVLRDFATEPAVFTPIYHPNYGGPDRETYMFRPEWKDHALSMDERFTITPADLINCCGDVQLAGAQFGVAIEYHPWIWPFTRTKIFAFVTRKQSNGQLSWYSIPNR